MKYIITLGLIFLMLVSVSACRSTRVEYVHVGPNWAALNDLRPSEKTFDVVVDGGRAFNLGDELSFTVFSEKDGQLWVVQVDPEDNVSLLFPNDRSKDNQISAGDTFFVPPPNAEWHIEAGKPTGKSVVAFIVTARGTDLEDVIKNQKSMTKALNLVENSPSWGLVKWVIDVK